MSDENFSLSRTASVRLLSESKWRLFQENASLVAPAVFELHNSHNDSGIVDLEAEHFMVSRPHFSFSVTAREKVSLLQLFLHLTRSPLETRLAFLSRFIVFSFCLDRKERKVFCTKCRRKYQVLSFTSVFSEGNIKRLAMK